MGGALFPRSLDEGADNLIGKGWHLTLRNRMTTLAVAGTLSVGGFLFVAPGVAHADNAPTQACGNTQPGPCSETDHFTNQSGFQSPIGATSTSCPSYVTNDFVLLATTGNGVEHVTLNKAQDFWFTTTFTGTGTATFYPASSLANIVTDDQGNIISADIVGPADATTTGKLTDWFGFSGNNKNAVSHGTINFIGTSASLHDTQHASWTGTQNPMTDPPHLAFNSATC